MKLAGRCGSFSFLGQLLENQIRRPFFSAHGMGHLSTTRSYKEYMYAIQLHTIKRCGFSYYLLFVCHFSFSMPVMPSYVGRVDSRDDPVPKMPKDFDVLLNPNLLKHF